MTRVNFEQLLEAGAHFGHLKENGPQYGSYISWKKTGYILLTFTKR